MTYGKVYRKCMAKCELADEGAAAAVSGRSPGLINSAAISSCFGLCGSVLLWVGVVGFYSSTSTSNETWRNMHDILTGSPMRCITIYQPSLLKGYVCSVLTLLSQIGSNLQYRVHTRCTTALRAVRLWCTITCNLHNFAARPGIHRVSGAESN